MNNNYNRPRRAAAMYFTTLLLLSACGSQSPTNTGPNSVNASNPNTGGSNGNSPPATYAQQITAVVKRP